MDRNDYPCTLYRHFDISGRLLYVGIAHDHFQRLHDYQVQTGGHYAEIATITLRHFDTRWEAARAEKEAIEHEDPLYNRKMKLFTYNRRMQWLSPD